MSKNMLSNIMKQAQQMQERVKKLQEEAAGKTVEASSGGGMVTVVANGRQEVLSIKIDPSVVDPKDIEMLQDLVTAAVILLAGYFLSNFISQAVLIAAVNAGLPPARLIAACSRWGIQALAGAMALEQLGIAQHIVVVGFGITWGGIVLAGAIAFGLGAADLAKGFLERRLVGRSKSSAVDDLHHL